MGLVWHEHKLYAADPPDLVVFEDSDDDGRADKRATLLTGFGHSDNGSLHGLTFGPDGWLYFTMGNPDSYDLTGPDGSHAKSRTGALIRCRPDGTRVETVALGFENLVEVAWLPDGSMIGTDNWFFLPERGVWMHSFNCSKAAISFARDCERRRPILLTPCSTNRQISGGGQKVV
jgi:glucose/arabinose dehydrogenase